MKHTTKYATALELKTQVRMITYNVSYVIIRCNTVNNSKINICGDIQNIVCVKQLHVNAFGRLFNSCCVFSIGEKNFFLPCQMHWKTSQVFLFV